MLRCSRTWCTAICWSPIVTQQDVARANPRTAAQGRVGLVPPLAQSHPMPYMFFPSALALFRALSRRADATLSVLTSLCPLTRSVSSISLVSTACRKWDVSLFHKHPHPLSLSLSMTSLSLSTFRRDLPGRPVRFYYWLTRIPSFPNRKRRSLSISPIAPRSTRTHKKHSGILAFHL